jgi:hypothetical protein
MTDRIEGVQHLRVLVSAVAGPDGGGASLGDVEKSRRGDNGGGLGDCGVLGPNGGGAGTMAAVGGASAALLSIGSMGVEAGTVAAAEAVTCMLTMALATCPTLSSRDGGPVLCEHVHVSLRESELDVRRVVTLLS